MSTVVNHMEQCRRRDKIIFDILDHAPVTKKHFVQLGVFSSYSAVSRRFLRLGKRTRGRKPRCIGSVMLGDCGRRSNLYCSYDPKAREHEGLLSDELVSHWPIPFTTWKRGINTDSDLRPDAEIDGLLIEYDRGTERRPVVQGQAKAYRDYAGIVVWIVPSMLQVEWIKRVTNPVNTLFKIHGEEDLFKCDGTRKDVAKLCSATLAVDKQPGTATKETIAQYA